MKKKGITWIYICYILIWEFDGGREESFDILFGSSMASNRMKG